LGHLVSGKINAQVAEKIAAYPIEWYELNAEYSNIP
jgi:hypothetical protein